LSTIPKPALIGGAGAVGLALRGAVGWIAFGGGGPAPATAGGGQAVTIATVRGAVQAELPRVPCSWLSLIQARQGVSGFDLAFSGVAGHPAAAEATVSDTVRARGAAIASSDFSGVAPVDASFCAALDSIRPIRSGDSPRLSVSQPRYEISRFTEGDYKGQLGARVIMDLALDGLGDDFALYSIEESGEVSEIIPSKAAFMSAVKSGNSAIEQLPGHERYRLSIDGTRKAGWSGILLLTGHSFNTRLLQNTKLPGWQAQFAEAAKSGGWKAEMVWFKFVDEVPN
jgi:serine/threonine-protein kinase